jgi:hypothetical protein
MPAARTDADCPRCGYDQRGAIVDWSAACPLTGVCVECGLAYRWSDIFGTSVHEPPRWSVEGRAAWLVPWTTLTTLVVAFTMPRFWSAFRMHHRLRPRRLAAFAVLLLALFYLPLTLAHGTTAWQAWGRARPQPSIPRIQYAAFAMALPLSERVWSGPRVQPVAMGRGTLRGPVRWRLPTSRELMGGRLHRALDTLPIVVGAVTCTAVMPLVFVALPISRRRAKVRWSHIWRIGVYSLSWLWLFTLLPGGLMPVAAAGFVGVLTAWWYLGVDRYLCMTEPGAVAGSLTLLAVLSAALAGCWTHLWLVTP